jgi:hypothetical protein
MDYRLQSIVNAAKGAKDYANSRAAQRRSATQGRDEVRSSDEITLARLDAEALTYQWVIDQLSTFEIPPAGGVDAAEPITSNRDHQGTVGGCRICTNNLNQAVTLFEQMCREAQSYGWNDSDAQTYKSNLGLRLRDLQSGMRNH